MAEAPKEIVKNFYANEIKLFGTYSYEVPISDPTLTDLIAINGPKANVYIPHTSGRYQVKRFRKATCPIVERLTNTLMRAGRNTGKKNLANQIVKEALDIVALSTGANPLDALLKAISNGAPREDSARTGSGGTAKKTAVDISPMRRVNLSLYLMSVGARKAAFRNIRSIAECLADEIVACSQSSVSSYAIRKKDEIERSAKANR
jgi:small subunit ribosomal protein S5e